MSMRSSLLKWLAFLQTNIVPHPRVSRWRIPHGFIDLHLVTRRSQRRKRQLRAAKLRPSPLRLPAIAVARRTARLSTAYPGRWLSRRSVPADPNAEPFHARQPAELDSSTCCGWLRVLAAFGLHLFMGVAGFGAQGDCRLQRGRRGGPRRRSPSVPLRQQACLQSAHQHRKKPARGANAAPAYDNAKKIDTHTSAPSGRRATERPASRMLAIHPMPNTER